MKDPTSWNAALEVRLCTAIDQVFTDMADEDVELPVTGSGVRRRMAVAAVSVLEAVAYHEMYLIAHRQLSLDKGSQARDQGRG